MSADPGQPSELEENTSPKQDAVGPPAAPPSPDPDNAIPAGGEEMQSPRRPIRIGSQREGFRPIRQTPGIRETWADGKTEPAAAPPSQAPSAAAAPQVPPPPAPSPPAVETAPAAATSPPPPLTPEQSAADSTPAAMQAADAASPAPVASPEVTTPAAAFGLSTAGEVAAPSVDVDDAEAVAPITRPRPRMPRLSADLQAEIDAALGDVSLSDESFAYLLDDVGPFADQPDIEPDTRRPGTIVKIHEDNVFFNLGTRHEGVASLRQFAEAPETGAQLEVTVNRFNSDDGLYEVTVPGASMQVEDWSDVAEGIVVEALITGHNTGGLECTVGHLRGFIPASQVSVYRVEDFEEYKDQKLQCVVTEANPHRRNLVLSRRAMIEREREAAREKLWEELEVGQIREGVVRRIQDFGAFVDIGGVDGLIHVSQLSWDRVGHPSEVLEEGQTIQVRIEKIDREADRIGLSYRDASANPWTQAESKYGTGSVVRGTVSRIMEFGAFVKLEPGVEGLVHISELAHHRVTRVGHVLAEGQEIDVKVLSVDADAQRISLSMKQANPLADAATADESPDDATAEEVREPAVPRHTGPLKGGVDRPSGGADFGLKW